MKKTTLYVCETPQMRDGSWSQECMRPILAGLCEIHGARFLYRTFTQAKELKSLLSREQLPRDDGRRLLVYVNAHGCGGHLATELGTSIKVKPVASSMAPHVEGVWISACDVGASTAMEGFLLAGKASWAGGYTCAVNLSDALMVDLAVLQAAITNRAQRTRRGIAKVLGHAFKAFSPNWVINMEGRIPLSRAFRVWGREHRQGPNTADITQEVMRRAEWPSDDANPAR